MSREIRIVAHAPYLCPNCCFCFRLKSCAEIHYSVYPFNAIEKTWKSSIQSQVHFSDFSNDFIDRNKLSRKNPMKTLFNGLFLILGLLSQETWGATPEELEKALILKLARKETESSSFLDWNKVARGLEEEGFSKTPKGCSICLTKIITTEKKRQNDKLFRRQQKTPKIHGNFHFSRMIPIQTAGPHIASEGQVSASPEPKSIAQTTGDHSTPWQTTSA